MAGRYQTSSKAIGTHRRGTGGAGFKGRGMKDGSIRHFDRFDLHRVPRRRRQRKGGETAGKGRPIASGPIGPQPKQRARDAAAFGTSSPRQPRTLSGRFPAGSVQSRNGCTYTRRTPFLPFCTPYRPKWPTCRITLKTSYFPHFLGGVQNPLSCLKSPLLYRLSYSP